MLDASLPVVYAGLLDRDRWLALERRAGAPAEQLFPAVGDALRDAGKRLAELDGFVFCEGPGSILGMRVASLAVRAWRRRAAGVAPCLAYGNLAVLAASLLERGESPPFGVISDARRRHWNLLAVDCDGGIGRPRRVDDAALIAASEPLWRSPEGGVVRPAPVPVRPLEYDLASAAPWFRRHGLLRPVENPEPLVLRPPEYARWRGGAGVG